MTVLTLITLCLIAFGLLGRRGYGVALALGGSTSAGVAIIAGAVAIPTFYATAIGATVIVLLRWLTSERDSGSLLPGVPTGSLLLILTVLWSIVITLAAPVLFDGLTVRGAKGSTELAAGFYASSNFAQVAYLVLGVGTFLFLAKSRTTRPSLVGVAVLTTTWLSFWRYGHIEASIPFPEGVFDNSPFATFIESSAGGGERFRGILSEPAGLASSCLVSIAYCLSRFSSSSSGWSRIGLSASIAACMFMGVVSTSTTFVAAGVLLVSLAVVLFVFDAISVKRTLTYGKFAMLAAILMSGVWLAPALAEFVQSAIDAKVGSSSYGDRSDANLQSMEVFAQTGGLGSGLGSNRASAFVPNTLSTIGLVGLLLFALTVFVLVVATWRIPSCRPAAWALLALLVVKLISGPDFSDSSGVLWLSLGVLANELLRREADLNRSSMIQARDSALSR